MDWTEEERSVFSHLIYHIMLISLVEVDPDPELEDHLFFMLDDIMDETRYYGSEVIVVRDSYRAQRKDFDDRHDRRIQFTVQVSEPGKFDLELCTDKIHQFYEKRGNKELKIIHQEPWKYFYRFDNEGLQKGIPQKFLQLQGHNRTAFVHSSGGCSAYNKKKINPRFLLFRFYWYIREVRWGDLATNWNCPSYLIGLRIDTTQDINFLNHKFNWLIGIIRIY